MSSQFHDPMFQQEAPLVDLDEFQEWILYEDSHVMALNKPGWLVCHPSKKGPLSSLIGAAKVYLDVERLHLVSRLDRETSGIVVIAKHRRSASQYQKAIEDRRVDKQYLTWLVGHFAGETIVNQPLDRDTESVVHVKQAISDRPWAQSAETHFKALEYSKSQNITLTQVTPITGRKHQIRAHTQWMGYPVYGDKLYGVDEQCYLNFVENGWGPELAEKLEFPRQALHAQRLTFRDVEYETEFEAPLTNDLLRLNRICEFQPSD